MRLPLIAALLLCASSLAGPPATNAAYWYQQAIEALGRLSEDDRAALTMVDLAAPTPELRALIERGRPAIDFAMRGSEQQFSDFGLDHSLGFELLLPHLRELRDIERLMWADTVVRLHDGDGSGAAGSLAAQWRMSGHLADDRTLISSLVGRAIFDYADRALQLGLDQAAFGAAESTTLLEAAQRLHANDPFQMVEAVAMEQQVNVTWLAASFAEGNAAGEGGFISHLSADPALKAQFMMMDEAQFQSSLEQYDRLMDHVVAAFQIEDPQLAAEVLGELGEGISRGDHGLLARVMVPALLKIHEWLIRSRETLAARTALLAALASGATAPADHANAVVYYLRAIELLGELGDLAPLRAHRGGPVGEELAGLLDRAAAVIELMHEGSTRRRCDFTFAREGWPQLAQRYLPGMRDLQRLLLAESVHLLQAGDTSGATEVLATAYRFAGHLGLDDGAVAALIAHDGFRRTHGLAAAALGDGRLPESARPALAEALEHIRRTDPFGYIGALAAERQRLRRWLMAALAHGEVPAEQRVEFCDRVNEGSADQVLFGLAIFDTLTRARQRRAGETPIDLGPLMDVLDPAGLESARNRAADIAAALAADELRFLPEGALPLIARIEQRQREARSDLRRAWVELKK